MKPPDQTKAEPEASGAGPTGQSKIGNQKSKIQRLLAYRTLWLVGTLVFVADQVTKIAVVQHVPYDRMHSHALGMHIEVIRDFFYIIHVGNTGAAWSMFSGMSLWLGLLAVGTLVAMFIWRHALGLHHAGIQPAFGLLCGGIVGNLIDRFRYGHVVDFVDLHFGNYPYPTFNVADSGICVGVFWYVLWSLRQPATTKET